MKNRVITNANTRTVDPTRTTALRNLFSRKMRAKFNALGTAITKAIVEEDVFGMEAINVNTIQTPGRRRFAFERSQDKVNAFMDWLRQQTSTHILEVANAQQLGQGIESAWTNVYISDSYRRGVMRGRTQMTSLGFNVPGLSSTGGIGAAMTSPFHVDRLGLLFSRVFTGLKGITDAMEAQISQILTQGMADGLGPRTIARQLNAVIKGGGADLGITDSLGRYIPGRRRAELLARTEIIRAHSQAQLQEFKNWRVENVTAKAEWITAGDNRVCNRCANLERSVFTVEEAWNMIPLHPNCRCAWLPYLDPE
jgi:SPP1 gp7 family putative phage head morphogenesis protein